MQWRNPPASVPYVARQWTGSDTMRARLSYLIALTGHLLMKVQPDWLDEVDGGHGRSWVTDLLPAPSVAS